MSFTEGSIGGDIERIDLDQLEGFYGKKAKVASAEPDTEPRGSNGIAIAPKLTSDGGALLLITRTRAFTSVRSCRCRARGPRRLRRRDLGSVLHLPGLQPARWLDAHLERRR